jgi:hypothetical protein
MHDRPDLRNKKLAEARCPVYHQCIVFQTIDPKAHQGSFPAGDISHPDARSHSACGHDEPYARVINRSEYPVSLQASNMLEKYYRKFEGNDQRCQRYQVILSNGDVYAGVPSAVGGPEKSTSFTVTLDSGAAREVKWNRLLEATPI